MSTMESQDREFEAVRMLRDKFHNLMLTPIVDDDYPLVRQEYESAVRDLLIAFQQNGRPFFAPDTWQRFLWRVETWVAVHCGESSYNKFRRWMLRHGGL